MKTSGVARLMGLLALLASLPINAYDFELDGIYYYIYDDNAYVTHGETKCRGDVVIPENVTYNGISYSVNGISTMAFENCKELTSILIPGSVTYIGKDAFHGCTNLISVIIPNSVTSIGETAFASCNLTSIIIPSSVTNMNHDAFIGCGDLTSIIVEAGNPKYDSRENCNAIIETASNTLFRGSNNTIIPHSVTSIDRPGFSGCRSMTSITIPNSVTSIGELSFSGCSGLKSISIPNSVTSIGWRAFFDCSGLASVTIPNSVTSIGSSSFDGCSGLTSITIPNSVEEIRDGAFIRCNSLSSIMVESGNPIFDSRDNCNAIIETSSNTLITGCKNTIIPISVTSIGDYAFWGCNGLTTITIPNSVTSIGSKVFYYCSGLTSITIPNSVTSIGFYAFVRCSGLTSIVSEIEKPFVINECFDNDTYTNAELIVPKGTKAAYQSTEGWNQFANIVEAPEKDEFEFTINGTTYQGSQSDNSALVKSVDPSMTNVEIPASVSYDETTYQITGIDDHAFDGSTMAALIWDVEAALSSKAFNNANIGSNFLLYVRSASYAPSSVKNVVVNGSAQSIVLSDDGGQFYCPQAFTAEKISYTHYYNMETGSEGKGWETIALPFNVQKISHSTRGEIIPFASYSSGSSEKPFWLANMSSSGFRRTSNIQSNEPYIIAMPNNNSYQNDYILTGDVTFSAENASVPKTPTFSGKFVPTFSTVSKSSNVYALNAVNKYVNATGGYDAGSRFISNLRDVRPFEAYISGSSSTRGVIEIDFDDDKTGLDNILFSTDENSEVTIYTISGRKVGNTQKGRLDETIEQLPKGVYIVNGKKIVK